MSTFKPDGWRTVTPRIFTDDVAGLVGEDTRWSTLWYFCDAQLIEITGATKIEIPFRNIHAITGCPHPGDPMPAFLSGPGPRPTPTPAC